MNTDLTGAVLAGGKSSRMGSDKAFLTWRGKTFVLHVADILAELCSTVVIVGDRKERFRELPLTCFEDIIPHAGPLGGIHSALTHARTSRVLICACDLPLISVGVVRGLVEKATTDSDMTITAHGNVIQPLLGIYGKRSLPKLAKFLEEGRRKVKEFLMENAVEVFDLAHQVPPVSEEILRNVNTLREYKEVLSVQ